MGFDAKNFIETRWSRRVKTIPVPDLADWFSEGEDPVWEIQSLEGIEVAHAREAESRNNTVKKTIQGIVSKNDTEKSQAVLEVLGLNFEKIPPDIAFRTELLRFGSVSPKVDYQLAACLHKNKYVVFFEITQEIIRLTGLGSEPGKPKASGKTKKSEQP